MPRYFFHHRNGGAFDDETGVELPDDAAVRREALEALPELARDLIPKDGDRQSFVVLVTDQDGRPVYSGTLSYAGVWLRPAN